MDMLFECYWLDLRNYGNRSKLDWVDVTFFDKSKGYTKNQIDDLYTMGVGDSANMSSKFMDHWVRRIS